MSEFFESGGFRVRILYEDNHLLAVEKPVNMPVQADSSGDRDLLSACKAYIGEKYRKPGSVYLGLVHRLDRPVGGVVVLARTSKAAARLSRQFAEHTVGKRYLAIVEGTLEEEMTLTDWLAKDERSGMVRIVRENAPGAKRAELVSRRLEEWNHLSLTEVELRTGRAHQIRVQHAHAGHPLWGDARYGHGRPGEQIALWAWRLTVEHPTLREPVTFVSPPPENGVWAHFVRPQAPI